MKKWAIEEWSIGHTSKMLLNRVHAATETAAQEIGKKWRAEWEQLRGEA